jgi:hypothetical protein
MRRRERVPDVATGRDGAHCLRGLGLPGPSYGQDQPPQAVMATGWSAGSSEASLLIVAVLVASLLDLRESCLSAS